MWNLYILRCAGGSLYTGIALDVRRRIKEHASGRGSKYVRSHLPAKLVYTETFKTKSQALKREACIKRFSRFQKLDLIERTP